MGLFVSSYGVEEIRLAGPRRGAPHVHADDRSGGGVKEDRRATGLAVWVGGVPDEHTRYVAEVTEQRLSLRLRLLCVPLFGVGGCYAEVLGDEASQRHELALAALSAELD